MQSQIRAQRCVPEDILLKKREADTLMTSVRSIYDQLKESYSKNQRYSFNLDDINGMLQTLTEEEEKYQENFDYYHKVLSEFYIKYNLPGTTSYFKKLYYNLSNTIYVKVRVSVDQYLKFLQEVQDTNVYFEKRKQRQQEKSSGFVATKSNSKSEKPTLDDGRSLPKVVTQEYDEKPRHRTIKTTRSYR